MNESLEILAIITKDFPEGKESAYESFYQDRPLDFFNYLKVLHPNEVFSLNHHYRISFQDEIITVSKISQELDLFSQGIPKIQVNAIVGKNGSGKSTLSELLYLMLYNLAVDQNRMLDEAREKVTQPKSFLNATLVLKKGESIVCVDFEFLDYEISQFDNKKDSKKIRCFLESFDKNDTVEINLTQGGAEMIDLDDLFYLISLNYSLYGLNEKKMGKWVKHVFHKNDMYDAPIVLNPYREEGIIDVNTEDIQNNARVISNLSKRVEGHNTTLSSDYRFKRLVVLYDVNNRKKVWLTDELDEYRSKVLNRKRKTSPAIDTTYNRGFKEYVPQQLLPSYTSTEAPDELVVNVDGALPQEERKLEVRHVATILFNSSEEAIRIIHKYFFNIKDKDDFKELLENIHVPEQSKIITDLFSYFICKLYRIGYNYPNEFGKLLSKSKVGFNEDLEAFEKELIHVLMSDSHACFKLKRLYYFVNYLKGAQTFQKVISNRDEVIAWKLEGLTNKRPSYFVSNDTFVRNPNHKREEFRDIDRHFFKVNDLAWRIPPPIFETKCLLEKNDGSLHALDQLSSGETQFIYTLQTILYHIINIDSNNKYSNIVVLLDEIELYHHPEYQRLFINMLVKQVKELALANIQNVQFLFLTHSPFILSDIPSSNILRLKNGEPQPKGSETFGGNIHDLLANDFFLENGFMGEFAKEKINEVIVFLNHEKIKKEKYELEKVEDKDKVKVRLAELRKMQKALVTKSTDLTLDKCQKIILLIGEPVLRDTLLGQCHDLIPRDEHSQISFFERLANKLNYSISKN